MREREIRLFLTGMSIGGTAMGVVAASVVAPERLPLSLVAFYGSLVGLIAFLRLAFFMFAVLAATVFLAVLGCPTWPLILPLVLGYALCSRGPSAAERRASRDLRRGRVRVFGDVDSALIWFDSIGREDDSRER